MGTKPSRTGAVGGKGKRVNPIKYSVKGKEDDGKGWILGGKQSNEPKVGHNPSGTWLLDEHKLQSHITPLRTTPELTENDCRNEQRKKG